ncbi:hypothetical protein AAVH_20541 [Aphelenchoides avenae]|nr:hypothetical protein AAVH_20541 [Aphelenchus avenae]
MGSAAGSYEKYVLTLVTCKTLYLFWIKYEFSSFLEATKKAPEDYAEVEDKDDGTAEEDEHSVSTAEMSDESEKDAEEDEQGEEHAEPETSESGVTDWEME